MTTQTEALKVALDFIERTSNFLPIAFDNEGMRICAAIQEALAQQSNEQKRPQNCGTSYCSCIECVMEPEQEPVAWLWVVDGKHHNVTFGGANSNTPKDWTVLPLYTHPPVPTAQPEQEPVAWLYEEECSSGSYSENYFEWRITTHKSQTEFARQVKPLSVTPQDQKKDDSPKDEALRLALEALKFSTAPAPSVAELQNDAITLIEQALENK